MKSSAHFLSTKEQSGDTILAMFEHVKADIAKAALCGARLVLRPLHDTKVVQGARIMRLGLDCPLELGACCFEASHRRALLAPLPLAHAAVI